MKKGGILHASLNAALSRLGHTDMVLLADCGMPAPAGVHVVDLAFTHGVPGFAEVLAALQDEYVFERCVAAAESKDSAAHQWISGGFVEVEYVSHEQLKVLSTNAVLFIRTGEATPYANAALYCGVPF